MEKNKASNEVEELYNSSFGFGVTSFSQLETTKNAMEKLDDVRLMTSVMSNLVSNILYDNNIVDKSASITTLTNEFTERVNMILAETEQSKGIVDKIKDAMKKLVKKEEPFATGMTVWKKRDGLYRWLAVYSNNFRDNDNPPEIISKQSHKRFDTLLDEQKAPMPELRHWHVKGSTYGIADWHTYDEETGFAVASGYILPGHEKEAEALAEMGDIAVSHGMHGGSIKRDLKDPSVIVNHLTFEISDLPRWAAANKLTSFSIMGNTKEADMPIPDAKKEYLKKVGLSDEKISEIEHALKETSDLAMENGIEFKEKAEEETPIVETPNVEKTVEKPPEEEPKEDEPEEEEKVPAAKEADLSQALTAVLSELVTPLTSALKSINERLDAIEAREKETVDPTTPTASLSAMIARQFSAIGSKDARVKSNTELFEAAPEQTPPTPDETSIHSVVQGIIGK